jgi:hypothetical protein
VKFVWLYELSVYLPTYLLQALFGPLFCSTCLLVFLFFLQKNEANVFLFLFLAALL